MSTKPSNNNTLIYVGLGIVIIGGITYYFMQQNKKKQGQKEVTLSTGEVVIVQTGTTNKMKDQLDNLHARYKNSTRFPDQLKIPFFRNFYITLYDNGRFFFGSDPKGLYSVNGYWKDYGNVLIFDDGRVFREKGLDDNLRLAKNAIFQNLDYFKDVDEYQAFAKKQGGNVKQMSRAKYEKIIELLRNYGAEQKYLVNAFNEGMNNGYFSKLQGAVILPGITF